MDDTTFEKPNVGILLRTETWKKKALFFLLLGYCSFLYGAFIASCIVYRKLPWQESNNAFNVQPFLPIWLLLYG